jgi:Protein of unknown function (DUF732)
MATLARWAQRDGSPLGERDGAIVADRDELIVAGHQVCASMDRGESMISASAEVMRADGLSGGEAGAGGRPRCLGSHAAFGSLRFIVGL